MMRATLRRTEMGDAGTFGTLTVDGHTFRSGELPWRENAHGKSCIPAGVYLVSWRPSGKYGRKFQLQDVPDRDHILIHAANYVGDEDKGYRAQVDGCIALGAGVSELDGQMAVRGSRDIVTAFEKLMNFSDFELEIIDEYLETGAPAGNVA